MVAALLVFLALAFLGTANGQETTQETELAAVRLAHFSPDAPLLDLLVDGRLLLRDLNFTELSSYLTFPAGEHELRIQPHRAPNEGGESQTTDIRAPEPFMISVTLEPGRYYTVVASGYFDPPPTEEELGAMTLSMTEGTTALVTGPRAFTATVTESSELTELLPGTYSVTASQEGFRTTEYEVQVRPNEAAFLSIALQANSEDETTEGEPAPVANELANTSLEWRKVQLQLYEDDLLSFPPPGTAYLRLIHASPTTPSVSVTLVRREGENETSETVISDVSYPNEADYLTVSAGQVSLRLLDTQSSEVLSELANLELHAGTVYTFLVVGTRDDNFVSVIPTIDALVVGQP
jgi:hypothetical protein